MARGLLCACHSHAASAAVMMAKVSEAGKHDWKEPDKLTAHMAVWELSGGGGGRGCRMECGSTLLMGKGVHLAGVAVAGEEGDSYGRGPVLIAQQQRRSWGLTCVAVVVGERMWWRQAHIAQMACGSHGVQFGSHDQRDMWLPDALKLDSPTVEDHNLPFMGAALLTK